MPTYRLTFIAYGRTLLDNYYRTWNLTRILREGEEQARKELKDLSYIYDYDPNSKISVTISSWV